MTHDQLNEMKSVNFGFVVRCPQCNCASQLGLKLLGVRVACPECEQAFVARDAELESAAMDEEVSELARVLDWQGEPTQFEPRPR